ncbi:MAG: acyl carrier protein [Planctomycetota bacterium]
MPSPEEIAAEVKRILQKTVKIDPEQVSAETNLKEDLNLDSLDMIEVVYEVEDHFDVQIPEESIKDIQTFQQVVDGLGEALKAKGA